MSTVEYTAPDGQTSTVSGPPAEAGTTRGGRADLVAFDEAHEVEDEKLVEAEQSWSDRLLSQVRELDATALAKQAIEKAAEEVEDEEDPDTMNVVPNRRAQRDAANLRGSARPTRSRIRRRIHRVLVKRGTWS